MLIKQAPNMHVQLCSSQAPSEKVNAIIILTYRRKILVYTCTLNWHDTALNSSSKLLKYIKI